MKQLCINALLAIGILTTCVLSSCNQQQQPVKHQVRLDNVVRVLMHQPGEYSIITKGIGADSADLPMQYIRSHHTSLRQDVASKKSMWVEYFPPAGEPSYAMDSLVIHLHSAEEINGAGWNHGKFGSGQTVVIE